ncbi:hypothetical protein N3C_2040 [Clostridium sp. N3C]|nr:hypothetical protein [Clostridium sp. N3C]SCN24899.1 hypothetical protein N3C_2040 [Clostridium sp. N3C]
MSKDEILCVEKIYKTYENGQNQVEALNSSRQDTWKLFKCFSGLE